jgi:hypothetical protein
VQYTEALPNPAWTDWPGTVTIIGARACALIQRLNREQVPDGAVAGGTTALEAQGMNLPARLRASPAQRGQEPPAILVIPEDRFAPVPAIHDVVNRARIFDSELARQAVE